jgi:hypothetical protein
MRVASLCVGYLAEDDEPATPNATRTLARNPAIF